MAIAILQGTQHNAMANRHKCNECIFMKKPHKNCPTTFKVRRHYSAISPSQSHISVQKWLITIV